MRPSRFGFATLLLASACAESASPRSKIVVSPDSVRLNVGEIIRLETNETSAPVVWRSAAPTVASVDAGGLVTAIGRGTTSVWAVRGADSAAASVEVIGVFCTLPVRVSPNNAVLAPGDTTRIEVRAGCGELTAGFTWTSSNAAAAVVELRENASGRSVSVVRALGPGQAVITARSVDDPAVSGSSAITVRLP